MGFNSGFKGLTEGVLLTANYSTPFELELNCAHQECSQTDFQVLPYPSFVGYFQHVRGCGISCSFV